MHAICALCKAVVISSKRELQARQEVHMTIHPVPTFIATAPPPARRRPRAPRMMSSPVPVPPELQTKRVVGLGACGMDALATVATFPSPDDKIRTKGLVALGGGNTANSLTALRRLGVPCSLISRLGDDANGAKALAELEGDGVDTDGVCIVPGGQTPFTYVIVDDEGSRTCIHTPGDADLDVGRVSDAMLDGASMLLLDGRHTLAAIKMARAANAKGIPVLVDVERDRPHVRTLLPLADYIVTSSIYPLIFAPGASGGVDAMIELLEETRTRFVITTAGSAGSVMVQPRNDQRERGSGGAMLVQSSVYCRRGALQREYEVLRCPAWPVKKVVDTTGAGDAFIGGVAYGIVTGLDHERLLCLAARVAAEKISGLGARRGLPRRENLESRLLTPLPKL